MTPRGLIAAARAVGLAIRPNGERIYVEPIAKLPAELRNAIVAQRIGVLRLLRAEVGLCSACGEPVTAPPGTIPFARRTEAGLLLHGVCWAESYEPATPPTANKRRRPGTDDQPRGAA